MKTEDKFMLGYVWALTILGALFYGHEFGVLHGQETQKQEDQGKILNCQRVIAGSLYK